MDRKFDSKINGRMPAGPRYTVLGMARRSLRENVREYTERAEQIRNYLREYPEKWPEFQDEFNFELDMLFKTILEFEREKRSNGEHDKVQKLKKLFVSRYRDRFKIGEYCSWSLEKPYGYAGDFKIINSIYENNPKTSGFERLFDNYFQKSEISRSVRSRKEDFKNMITDFIRKKRGACRIMNLACGPCREIGEILRHEDVRSRDIIFDCYDNDHRALDFAKRTLPKTDKIRFFKKNALRIAASKDIVKDLGGRYDLIYSTGLFDYLPEKIAVKLIVRLKRLLRSSGQLLISNVRDKYSNPSVHFMEWAGDWDLIYRTEEQFKEIFTKAGFKETDISIRKGRHNIMQYASAEHDARKVKTYLLNECQ